MIVSQLKQPTTNNEHHTSDATQRTSPMKELECIRQGQIGGGESHLLSLVENLDRSKSDPIVLSFTDGPMIQRLGQMNIPTRIIPTLKPFDVRKWKAVKHFLQEQQIE